MVAGSTQPDPLPRGVYFARFSLQGDPFVYAVDSRGNATKIIRLTGGMTEDRAVQKLRDWLDANDPVPQLRLVREGPAPAYDPRASRSYNTELIEPIEAHWRRLAQAGGSRWRRYR